MSGFDYIAWKEGSKVHLARLVCWVEGHSDDLAMVDLRCGASTAMHARHVIVQRRCGGDVLTITCKSCLRAAREHAADWMHVAQIPWPRGF